MNAVASINTSEQVDVQVYTFSELLNLGYPLALDNYQRPYVWDREKIEQLVQDLHEFEQQNFIDMRQCDLAHVPLICSITSTDKSLQIYSRKCQ